jgi:phospholipase C
VPTPTASATPTPNPTPTDCGGTCPHVIRTVFLILMENHNWADVKGSASAPYINGTLLAAGAHAEQYYNPPGIHPSEPNYIWLEAGSNLGITNDGLPSANHRSTTAHLVTLLANAGVGWTSYQEDIDGTTCPLANVNRYAPKHDPMVFFDDVTDVNDPQSATCIAHVRPYTELASDLQNDTVARYNFITPNLCNDMHDSCAPLFDRIAQGDGWLAAAVPMIQSSAAYQNDGAILITFDEGESLSDGPIGMIVVSPRAKAGYENAIHYTHSSTLRSLQEIFGALPLLGDAANATNLADLFTAFP